MGLKAIEAGLARKALISEPPSCDSDRPCSPPAVASQAIHAAWRRNAESKDREDFLKTIPLPDDVFLAAAKRAVINAGMSDEIVEILHPEISGRSPPVFGTQYGPKIVEDPILQAFSRLPVELAFRGTYFAR
jgi:hypothetical protein